VGIPADNHSKALLRILFWVFLFCFAGMSPSSLIPSSCWGADSTFSLDVKDEPLNKILEKIAEDMGYEITANRKLADVSVTTRLKNVTVEEAVKRLLKNFSYALVTEDLEKRISIMIYDASASSRVVVKWGSKEHVQQEQLRQQDLGFDLGQAGEGEDTGWDAMVNQESSGPERAASKRQKTEIFRRPRHTRERTFAGSDKGGSTASAPSNGVLQHPGRQSP
jgi:hypothetical protein